MPLLKIFKTACIPKSMGWDQIKASLFYNLSNSVESKANNHKPLNDLPAKPRSALNK